jgi:hypothetical protein
MDAAQAKSRPYLSIKEVFDDLGKSEKSSASSIARLLLHSVELHTIGIGCRLKVPLEPKNEVDVNVPEFRARAFLEEIAEAKNAEKVLSELIFEQAIVQGSGEGFGGQWYIPDPATGKQEERRTLTIPFSKIWVEKPALEQRLTAFGITIPRRWTDGGDEIRTEREPVTPRSLEERVRDYVVRSLSEATRPYTRSGFVSWALEQGPREIFIDRDDDVRFWFEKLADTIKPYEPSPRTWIRWKSRDTSEPKGRSIRGFSEKWIEPLRKVKGSGN